MRTARRTLVTRRHLSVIVAVLGLIFATVQTRGFATVDVSQISGTYYGDDNGVYYAQRSNSTLWWVGESVDKDHVDGDPSKPLLGPTHVFRRGLVSTSVFEGRISGDSVTGDWVEVSRGSSLKTGHVTLAIGTDGTGTHFQLTISSGTGPNGATVLTQGDPVNDYFFQYTDGHTALVDFYNRFVLAKKNLLSSGADCGCGDSLGDTHNPDELRPYRDQTVFYGMLEQTGVNGQDNIINAESPHANLASDAAYDYATFACRVNDGDLDLRVRVDDQSLTSDYTSGLGWGNSNSADENESDPPGSDYHDLTPKLSSVGPFNPGYHLGVEGVMYGGDNVGTGGDNPADQKCPSRSQVNVYFPGWADTNGNSVVVNGMPINGSTKRDHLIQDSNPNPAVNSGQTPLAGLNGITWTAALPPNRDPVTIQTPIGPYTYTYPTNMYPAGAQPLASDAGTEVRVTGALILDCGHTDGDDGDTFYGTSLHNCDQGEGYSDIDDQNQEIHPFYALDIIKCPLGYAPGYCTNNTARANLTGAWGSNDGGTYYIRQVGNDIWWAGLTRDRDPMMPDDVTRVPSPIPNPTNVFHGTITRHSDGTATITGDAVTAPKGNEAGGDVTTATFTVGADRKSMDLVSSSSSTFPWPGHFDKLYEPPTTVPPTSTLTVGTPKYTSGGTTYVTSATPLTLTGVNGSDGMQNVWYRIYPAGSTAPDFTPVLGSTATLHVTGSDGLYTIDSYATDNAGNDEKPHTTSLYLDNSGPQVTITSPANGTIYTVGQALSATYGCTDTGSGVATCTGPVASGTALSTSTPGSFTFTVNASDNLANLSSSTASYVVSYRICLLYDPRKALGTPNSTVAVKLQLCDVNGKNLSSPSITVTALNVDGTKPPIPAGSSNPGFVFRYDATIAGYIYNLQTKGFTSGSHILNFSVAGDPVKHGAEFVLK